MVKLENPRYMDKSYPFSYLVAGWSIFSVGIAQVFIWSIFYGYQKNFEGKFKFQMLFEKNMKWGPSNQAVRYEWKKYKEEKMAHYFISTIGHSKLKRILWNLLGKY